MILGYTLFGYDNDSYMLNDDENLESPTCQECGFLLDFNYHNPFFKIKRKQHDLSHPYDMGFIVSLKFKEFIEREGYSGIECKKFELEPNFYQLIVKRKVIFDHERREVQFKNYCIFCSNYEEAIGADPAFLKNIHSELEDGFYRSDLLFGSKNHKSPVLIVGIETQKKMKREKLKGLIFNKIES
jgi:hypothetical protein